LLKKNAILYMYPPVFIRVSAMYPLCIRYVSAMYPLKRNVVPDYV